jgi:hypothetical protein
MVPRILLTTCLIAIGYFIADARAQTPSSPGTSPQATTPAPAPPSDAGKRETRKQTRAAKKAERIAIRKKRAECYDQAKKQSLAGQELIVFVETCNKK